MGAPWRGLRSCAMALVLHFSRRHSQPDAGVFCIRLATFWLSPSWTALADLLDLIDRIGKSVASFRSCPLGDTGSLRGRLLSTMLAAIAEFERELIRERTGEGRKRAMANGVKFGRHAM
jgi:DNA invertase Pin-like site-specific DNA recombinase